MWQPMNRRSYAEFEVPDFNMLNFGWDEPGTAKVQLSTETGPFRVAIHSPGFLQCFERGPFTLSDVKDGKLEIEVEKPATLDIRFDPSAKDAESLPLQESRDFGHVEDSRNRQFPSLYRQQRGQRAGSGGQLQLADLAAGDYRVTVRTKPKPAEKPAADSPPTAPNPASFSAMKVVSLQAGASEQVDFQYKPLDPKAFLRRPHRSLAHSETRRFASHRPEFERHLFRRALRRTRSLFGPRPRVRHDDACRYHRSQARRVRYRPLFSACR